jgi:hypothetical protein
MKLLPILLLLISCSEGRPVGSRENHKKMAITYCSCHGGIDYYNRDNYTLEVVCKDGSYHKHHSLGLLDHEFQGSCE